MEQGNKIVFDNNQLIVPNNPVIPFIEGDGIGPDIWYTSQMVFDHAVKSAYGDQKKIAWKEIHAGEKAFNEKNSWLPDESLDSINKYLIAIKGPLTTPVGGGMRSLNVTLRQVLDLYACVRPVTWFKGVPSPVKDPSLVDMVIFRENTEDIYAGIEWPHGSDEVEKVKNFLINEMNVTNIRFPDTVSLGVKPVSVEGTERIVRAALEYAITHNRKSVTLVHKGNIMKFTEGKFKEWGYALAKKEFNSSDYEGGPWQVIDNNGKPVSFAIKGDNDFSLIIEQFLKFSEMHKTAEDLKKYWIANGKLMLQIKKENSDQFKEMKLKFIEYGEKL